MMEIRKNVEINQMRIEMSMHNWIKCSVTSYSCPYLCSYLQGDGCTPLRHSIHFNQVTTQLTALRCAVLYCIAHTFNHSCISTLTLTSVSTNVRTLMEMTTIAVY